MTASDISNSRCSHLHPTFPSAVDVYRGAKAKNPHQISLCQDRTAKVLVVSDIRLKNTNDIYFKELDLKNKTNRKLE